MLDNEPKEEIKCFKMSKKMELDVMKFVTDRDWKFSSFVRRAILESMQRVKDYEAGIVADEGSGD